jgi:hypothetical protein
MHCKTRTYDHHTNLVVRLFRYMILKTSIESATFFVEFLNNLTYIVEANTFMNTNANIIII